MTLADFLMKRCGNCSTWEQAAAALDVQVSTLRWVVETVDPKMVSYFDRKAAEERARKAEQQASDAAGLLIAAERQLAEWRSCAEHGARLVVDAADGDDFAGGRIKAEMAILWARDVAPARIDPAAGTGDHEREPGRNDEPAPVRVDPWLPRALREAGLAPSCSAARRFVTTSQVSVDCVIVTDPKTNLEPGDHVLRCGDGDALVRVEG
jgi:hypothetical protein